MYMNVGNSFSNTCTPQVQKKKKNDVGTKAVAMATGSIAGTAIKTALTIPAAIFPINKMSQIAQSVNAGEIKQGLEKALEISGMKKKGVSIVDYAGRNASQTVEGLKPKIMEFLKEQSSPFIAAEKGKNAFFIPFANEIHINTEKFGTSGFHEIGHSINFNSSKFWKTIQLARKPLMMVPALLMSVALLKNKKAEGEKPKGVFDKATTFIKEHVGVLSAASMLPGIAEELKATASGNALAKKILSPENFKKVVKANRYGAISYILAAVAVGVGAYAANKIRDNIVEKHQQKKIAK